MDKETAEIVQRITGRSIFHRQGHGDGEGLSYYSRQDAALDEQAAARLQALCADLQTAMDVAQGKAAEVLAMQDDGLTVDELALAQKAAQINLAWWRENGKGGDFAKRDTAALSALNKKIEGILARAALEAKHGDS